MPTPLKPTLPLWPWGAPSSPGLTSHAWPLRGAIGVLKGTGGTGKEQPGWMECNNGILRLWHNGEELSEEGVLSPSLS